MGCRVCYEGTSYRSRVRILFESRHTLLWLKHKVVVVAEPNTGDDEIRRRELRRDVVTKRRTGFIRKLDNHETVVISITYRNPDGQDVLILAENRIEWDVFGCCRGYNDAFFDCKVYEDGHPMVMEYLGDRPQKP